MPPPPVLVVAHRGSSGEQPEHTLAAYEAAVAEGADALECDVRLTRDGHLVCVHDRKVNRTSDGRGVVSSLELADLAELDFASWKDRGTGAVWAGEEPDGERGRVLTLETLLRLVLDCERPVQLHIEAKHPTRYGGFVERALVALLARYGLATPATRASSRVTVMSFAPTSLRRVHALAPALPTVLLMERLLVHRRDGSLPPRVGAVGASVDLLRAHPRYPQRVHERGGRLHVYTVDEPADIDLVLGLGVDAVISNHPRRVLRSLGRSVP